MYELERSVISENLSRGWVIAREFIAPSQSLRLFFDDYDHVTISPIPHFEDVHLIRDTYVLI